MSDDSFKACDAVCVLFKACPEAVRACYLLVALHKRLLNKLQYVAALQLDAMQRLI